MHEIAAGVLYWLEATSSGNETDASKVRDQFEYTMRELLPVVNDKVAENLLEYYPLLDPKPYSTMEELSGYGPLRQLLRDSEVPGKYKDILLTKWFAIAKQEETGQAEPRMEHERAVEEMAYFLSLEKKDDSSVDSKITTSVVNFLENIIPANEMYVQDYAVSQIMKRITSPELRFRFALRHVFKATKDLHGYKDKFNVNDKGRVDLVEWTLQAAQERGLSDRYSAKAKALIKEYEASQKAEQRKARANQRKEKAAQAAGRAALAVIRAKLIKRSQPTDI